MENNTTKPLSIREQIKKQPGQHIALFACYVFGLFFAFSGGVIAWEPFLAAGLVVSAIIDSVRE